VVRGPAHARGRPRPVVCAAILVEPRILSARLGLRPPGAILLPCAAASVFLRCQRDQTRLLDPVASADAEHRVELECGANRSPARLPVRQQCGQAQPRCDALGPGAILGQGHKVGFANINAKAEGIETKPAFLGPQDWPAWLGEEPADPVRLKMLLAPYPSDEMTCWPMSTRVGNVKNNDASLIEPIALSE
jgi:hypothetical protein